MTTIRIAGFGKGQMKIKQMAFMLLAVTLFFILAGMFFLMIQLSNIKGSATEQESKNAELLVKRLANTPEFSCHNAFDNIGANCVDLDKFLALKLESEKYVRYWGKNIESIELRIIYPKMENEVICETANYPNCNVIRLYDSGVSGTYHATYVAACRKESEEGEIFDKCELAHLMISYSDYE
jgi:hypothetical protein